MLVVVDGPDCHGGVVVLGLGRRGRHGRHVRRDALLAVRRSTNE